MSTNPEAEQFAKTIIIPNENIFQKCSRYDVDYLLYLMVQAGYISSYNGLFTIPNPFLQTFLANKIFIEWTQKKLNFQIPDLSKFGPGIDSSAQSPETFKKWIEDNFLSYLNSKKELLAQNKLLPLNESFFKLPIQGVHCIYSLTHPLDAKYQSRGEQDIFTNDPKKTKRGQYDMLFFPNKMNPLEDPEKDIIIIEVKCLHEEAEDAIENKFNECFFQICAKFYVTNAISCNESDNWNAKTLQMRGLVFTGKPGSYSVHLENWTFDATHAKSLGEFLKDIPEEYAKELCKSCKLQDEFLQENIKNYKADIIVDEKAYKGNVRRRNLMRLLDLVGKCNEVKKPILPIIQPKQQNDNKGDISKKEEKKKGKYIRKKVMKGKVTLRNLYTHHSKTQPEEIPIDLENDVALSEYVATVVEKYQIENAKDEVQVQGEIEEYEDMHSNTEPEKNPIDLENDAALSEYVDTFVEKYHIEHAKDDVQVQGEIEEYEDMINSYYARENSNSLENDKKAENHQPEHSKEERLEPPENFRREKPHNSRNLFETDFIENEKGEWAVEIGKDHANSQVTLLFKEAMTNFQSNDNEEDFHGEMISQSPKNSERLDELEEESNQKIKTPLEKVSGYKFLEGKGFIFPGKPTCTDQSGTIFAFTPKKKLKR